jgi:(2R)-sulfolactate sulfo-lyase subunit alpha
MRLEDTALPPLLLLHPEDNVFVTRRNFNASETIAIEGLPLTIQGPVPLGHKVARVALAPGSRIVKYGASIGSATRRIEPGEHVHMHNMKSDYLPPHTRHSTREDG